MHNLTELVTTLKQLSHLTISASSLPILSFRHSPEKEIIQPTGHEEVSIAEEDNRAENANEDFQTEGWFYVSFNVSLFQEPEVDCKTLGNLDF